MKTENLTIDNQEYDVTFFADEDSGDWETPPSVEITIVKIEQDGKEIENIHVECEAEDIINAYQLWKD